jgi:hypothetical protein
MTNVRLSRLEPVVYWGAVWEGFPGDHDWICYTDLDTPAVFRTKKECLAFARKWNKIKPNLGRARAVKVTVVDLPWPSDGECGRITLDECS